MSFRRHKPIGPTPPKGTRVSVHNHQTLTSTGIPSMDELFGGGIPMGRILLVKQDRFSGYSNLIFKYFLRQGIQSDHEILLASLEANPEDTITDLMGIANGKVTNQNQDDDFIPALPNSTGRSLGQLRPTNRVQGGNMEIAWRYQGMQQFSNALESNARGINGTYN